MSSWTNYCPDRREQYPENDRCKCCHLTDIECTSTVLLRRRGKINAKPPLRLERAVNPPPTPPADKSNAMFGRSTPACSRCMFATLWRISQHPNSPAGFYTVVSSSAFGNLMCQMLASIMHPEHIRSWVEQRYVSFHSNYCERYDNSWVLLLP